MRKKRKKRVRGVRRRAPRPGPGVASFPVRGGGCVETSSGVTVAGAAGSSRTCSSETTFLVGRVGPDGAKRQSTTMRGQGHPEWRRPIWSHRARSTIMRGQGRLAGYRPAAHGVGIDAGDSGARVGAGSDGRDVATVRSGAPLRPHVPRFRLRLLTFPRPGAGRGVRVRRRGIRRRRGGCHARRAECRSTSPARA